MFDCRRNILGGNLVKRSCEAYIQTNGDLKEGEIFVGNAGKLDCKNVVHITCPKWKGGNEKEEDKLEEMVFKALNSVSVRFGKSIALPAIGCGNYG